MPARARNSVDLPEPERPVTTTEWPGTKRISAPSSRLVPLGSVSVRPLTSSASPAGAGRNRPLPTAARATTMARWKEVRRSTVARQLARDGICADEPGHAALHVAEGVGGLRQAAQRKLAGEIARCRDDDGEDDGDLVVAGDQGVQQLGPPHDRPPVVDHVAEPVAQVQLLLRLAAIERDAFDVLPQAHQGVAEIRLDPLLAEAQGDQGPADEMREHGADRGVDQRDPDHVAGDRMPNSG